MLTSFFNKVKNAVSSLGFRRKVSTEELPADGELLTAGLEGSFPESDLDGLTPTEAPPFSLPTGTFLPAKILDVYDGDTVTMATEVFPGILPESCPKIFRSFKLRLEGIDTPELRPPLNAPAREKIVAAAEAARAYLVALVFSTVVFVTVSGTDKFGRQLGKIYISEGGKPGACVNDLILADGFGKPYDGGARS